jgi:hypothetical protein
MNDGQIDKLFYVFGSKSREIINQFIKSEKNRFYLDFKLAGDRYFEFIIIDASEIQRNDFNQWIEGISLLDPIIFIVNDEQCLLGYSLITYTLKLDTKFGSHKVFSIKNHGELVSVLEGVSELQNGHSIVCIDHADFNCFLRTGQYYWSDTVYSHSINELKLRIVEKLENVKTSAKQSGLKLSGLFGCMKGIAPPDCLEDYELIVNTLRELEPLLYDSSGLMIHTNLRERTDTDVGYDMGFHMLWALSDREVLF